MRVGQSEGPCWGRRGFGSGSPHGEAREGTGSLDGVGPRGRESRLTSIDRLDDLSTTTLDSPRMTELYTCDQGSSGSSGKLYLSL